jgi:hypothetical protein
MSNDVRILLKADLNKGLSINEINKSIKEIQKSDSLQKIKIKVDIDQKFTQSINSFISAVSKMKKISDEQSKVVNQVQTVYKELDGSIKTTTQTILKNGEILTKTKVVHDATRKIIQDESNAVANLTENVKKLNSADLDSIKVLKNKTGAITSYNVKSSQGYTLTNNRIGADGQTMINSSITTNYKKQREDQLREQARLNKATEALDRDHFNALKSNQKRKEDMEKLHYLALQQNRQRDITFQQSIASQQAKINDTMRRFGTDSNVKNQLQQLNTQLNNVKPIGNYKNALKDLDIQLKNIVASVKTSGSHIDKMAQAFSQAMTKFPIWMLSATLFYAPIRALQDMTQTIIQVDTQMTQLKRVMDQDTNFDNMMKSAIDLSTQLGRSIGDTMENMIGFARQGFDEIESTNLAQTSLLLQNISELKPQESIDALTSAMIVFNIESSKSIEIANKLNEIDNNYAVTTQNLAISMQKASSSAKTFGVSLDELLGHSTAIMSVTRESGAIVGKMMLPNTTMY